MGAAPDQVHGVAENLHGDLEGAVEYLALIHADPIHLGDGELVSDDFEDLVGRVLLTGKLPFLAARNHHLIPVKERRVWICGLVYG